MGGGIKSHIPFTPRKLYSNDKLKERLCYIDFAKLFALVLVILSHSSDHTLMSWSRIFFIPIFFICSGFTSKNNLSIKGKAKSLLIPYFLLNFLLFLFVSLLNKEIEYSGLAKILYSRYCLFPLGTEENIYFFTLLNFPLWFLTALFIAYIFFKLILITPKKYKGITILGLFLSSYAMSFLPILLPWSIDTAPLFAVYMWVGNQLRKINLSNIYLVICSIIIYVLLYKLIGEVNLSVRIYGNSYFLAFIGGILGSIGIIGLIKLVYTKPIAWIDTISKKTLVIFSLQIPFLIICQFILYKVFLEISTSILAICQTFFALSGGYLISLLLGKISLRFLHKNYF